MNDYMKQYPPRPVLNDAIREAAIDRWAATQEVDEHLWPECLEMVQDHLKDLFFHSVEDGYQLGKKLEIDCNLDVNFWLCNSLNDLGGDIEAALREAEAEWVKSNNIKPEFSPGEKVIWGADKKSGLIHSVDDYHPARYRIRLNPDSDLSACFAVKFEDVLKAVSS